MFNEFLRNQKDSKNIIWRVGCKVISLITSKIIVKNRKIRGVIFKCKISENNKGCNSIIMNEGSVLKNCKISFEGKEGTLEIGSNCFLQNAVIILYGNNASCIIGSDVKINASVGKKTVFNVGGESSLAIGKGALLSKGVGIYTTDFHKIMNSDGEQINENKDVNIGSNVWIGMQTTVLKGSVIANNNIVGACSVVCGEHKHENVIIAGNPAKEIKQNVKWEK